MDFSSYKCALALRYFEKITKIPRSSGNEAGIARFIYNIAAEKGYFAVLDGSNNVFVRVPASYGREKDAPIALQGHTDMVCEADTGINIDFAKDGLDIYVENGHLRARGTTLGADNGVAVAAMLAVMDGALESHPETELVFTSDEEVGLIGAASFDKTLLHSRRMINLDSEEEGVAVCACAGGVRTDFTCEYEKTDFDGVAVKITADRLLGGHSGADIHLNRGNAIIITARAIEKLISSGRVNLSSFEGGAKDNAIPRYCSATVALFDLETAKKVIAQTEEEIKKELTEDERGFTLTLERCDAPDKMLSRADTKQFISFLTKLPHGVLKMSDVLKDMVETSANTAVVRTTDEGFKVTVSSRSSEEEQIDRCLAIYENLAVLNGITLTHRSRYPGWRFEEKSPLRELYVGKYQELFGKTPKVTAIHAGLEAGLFKGALPEMDIISIGPDIYDIHTPREALSLSSCDNFWLVLKAMLEEKQ